MEIKKSVEENPRHEEVFKKAGLLTPQRMRTLCAVVEYGSYQRAASALGMSTAGVSQNIRDLESQIFHSPLVVRQSKGRSLQVTTLGRELAREFRQILETQWSMVADRRPMSIRYLPHHSVWVLPAIRELERAEGLVINPSVLGEHHRAVDHFVDKALRPIAAGLLDVAVGLDFRESEAYASVTERLTATPLYTARLEALVLRDEGLTAIDVTELLERRLLTAPAGTRSREYLQSVVGAQHHGKALDVHLQEYESKVLVIGTYSELGTTVLPSDVAIQFDSDWDEAPLAGGPAARYRWIPVLDNQNNPLEYDVVAYRRSQSQENVGAILVIRALRTAATKVMRAAGRLSSGTDPQD